MYRIIIALGLIGSAFLLNAQYTMHFTVYFPTDQYELLPEARTTLDQLLLEAGAAFDAELNIQAHTDAEGGSGYNDALAKRRAEAVRSYLLKHGMEPSAIKVSAFGERRPAEDNLTEEGRRANRRVNLELTLFRLDSLEDLLARLRSGGSQYYTIDPNHHTVLTGAAGTTLWIEAGAFILPDGTQPQGPVRIELKEAYGYNEMILAGLMTQSGTGLLETGGMVFWQATADGQPLQLNDGQTLLMALPTETQQPGMELFTGKVDPQGRLTDWEPAGQDFSPDLEAALRLADPPPFPAFTRRYAPPNIDRSGEPEKPRRPRAPFLPKPPRREGIQYEPGLVKRLVMGKKEIEAREEAIYQEKMAEYERRYARYQKDSVVFEQAIPRYHQEVADYQQAMAEWQKNIQQQLNEHHERLAQADQQAYQEQMEKYRRDLSRWETYKQEKLRAYETQYAAGGFIDRRSLTNYFFRVNQMGWINCDRFYNVPESEKQTIVIKDTDEAEEMVSIIFKELNSMIRATRMDAQYVTSAVPRGTPIRILALKVDRGRALMALEETKAGQKKQHDLSYRPCSLEEIREALAALN